MQAQDPETHSAGYGGRHEFAGGDDVFWLLCEEGTAGQANEWFPFSILVGIRETHCRLMSEPTIYQKRNQR